MAHSLKLLRPKTPGLASNNQFSGENTFTVTLSTFSVTTEDGTFFLVVDDRVYAPDVLAFGSFFEDGDHYVGSRGGATVSGDDEGDAFYESFAKNGNAATYTLLESTMDGRTYHEMHASNGDGAARHIVEVQSDGASSALSEADSCRSVSPDGVTEIGFYETTHHTTTTLHAEVSYWRDREDISSQYAGVSFRATKSGPQKGKVVSELFLTAEDSDENSAGTAYDIFTVEQTGASWRFSKAEDHFLIGKLLSHFDENAADEAYKEVPCYSIGENANGKWLVFYNYLHEPFLAFQEISGSTSSSETLEFDLPVEMPGGVFTIKSTVGAGSTVAVPIETVVDSSTIAVDIRSIETGVRLAHPFTALCIWVLGVGV
jgi:hypothetical protein